MHGGKGGDPIEVEISDTQGHLRVEPDELAALVRAVLSAEGHRRASISIAMVDQSTIHAINRSHLGHDWPTDVISFPLPDPDGPTLAGELIVSAEMAALMADEMGVDPRDELALYIVHGLLHLCGYDDLSQAGAAAMRRREDELLMACGRSNPFHRAGRRGPSPCQPEAAVPSGQVPSLAGKSESSTWSA